MKKRMASIAIVAFMLSVLTIQPADAELVASITLDQQAITLGQTVTFTEVYPKEAATSKQSPQYPENPLTEVVCYQNGVIIWANFTAVDSKTNVHLGNGWTQSTTAPMKIGGPSGVFIGSAADWSVGAGNCLAMLWSATTVKQVYVQTVWATATFDVVP